MFVCYLNTICEPPRCELNKMTFGKCPFCIFHSAFPSDRQRHFTRLIGKQFNIENVKTQISQETNYYLQNNILTPQTR